MLARIKSSKKGMSEMVAYVLLVVIAVGLSVLVYGYLKIYVPKNNLGCPTDVHITLDDYTCVGDGPRLTLNLALRNRGLYSFNGAYVRIGKPGEVYRELLNTTVYLDGNLVPGNVTNRIYTTINGKYTVVPANYILEIEPAILKGRAKPTLCNEALITQEIECLPYTIAPAP